MKAPDGGGFHYEINKSAALAITIEALDEKASASVFPHKLFESLKQQPATTPRLLYSFITAFYDCFAALSSVGDGPKRK
jgi:hypothetical protein